MFQRPKPGEEEDDILRMQEEFLREKNKNVNLQPAAQVVNLRNTNQSNKRASTSDSSERKPSKYALSKGLKNHVQKRQKTDENKSSIIGSIFEKNIEKSSLEIKFEDKDDNVYYPKVLPSLLGDIVEKNLNQSVDLDFKEMPLQGFPVVTNRDTCYKEALLGHVEDIEQKTEPVEIAMDVQSCSNSDMELAVQSKNLPTKSYIISSKDAEDIHTENVEKLKLMSEKEILKERQMLLSNLDPKLIQFLKAKRKQTTDTAPVGSTNKTTKDNTDVKDLQVNIQNDNDSLWENDVLSHPQIDNWLHFDTLEKDKLEWMKGIEDSKKLNPDEPYEARFDFKGYLLPYSLEYTEKTKTLFHHGNEPNRPGYSLIELFELSRSAVTQQRVMALSTIAGILEYYSAGTYKDILELPLSKILFVIRIAMDENKTIILEPALKAMRNLIFNRVDEACLDALLGFEEGTQQPCLENDKSEIQELETHESELNDYHLAEIDLIAALLRTDIIQRLYYILETIRPTFNSVQYALQILTRLVRDSIETAFKICETEHLMNTVIRNFIPTASINFTFDPQIVYNGKPILAALKLLRILSLQSKEIGNTLITNYDILKPISEYISSSVDGTYGLNIQIESLCILSNLLQYNNGIETAVSLLPIIMTTLYKHVQGTDIFPNSSVISATHAAVILQFVNKLINTSEINLDKYKYQLYPLVKEGVQKWVMQVSQSEYYTCGHLRLVCAVLDCCKTVLLTERISMPFLVNTLKILSTSKGFKGMVEQIVPSSNLLSGLENSDLQLIRNLKSLGSSVIDSRQKVLPILNIKSPIPFLASLFNLLVVVNEKDVLNAFVDGVQEYLRKFADTVPSLCDNWFTRIEVDFLLFGIVKLSIQNYIPESQKDIIYIIANKLCYILRVDKRYELDYLFQHIVFNKEWFTAERLFNLISVSDTDGFARILTSIDDIRICYSRVINFGNNTGPNVVLRKWQEPILPRDWIYLPILNLYSKSQEANTIPKIVGEHSKNVAAKLAAEKEMVTICSLEWIIFNELCFSDLLNDISVTDRFCRIMCVFLSDNSVFLDDKVNVLLQKCTQILFKKKDSLDFDQKLVGLNNFQDFYTQFLEQFQSVSYGDHTFAACVLVPLAQKHNIKWRKLLWSEYAGCLRALDCPEELLCYEMKDYFYPPETDESLIKSYYQALSSNLLRPGTIAYRIAQHHVQQFKSS